MLLQIKIRIPKRQALTRILATNCITSFEKYKIHRHTIVEETQWTCSCTTILFKIIFWPFCLYFARTVEETGNDWIGERRVDQELGLLHHAHKAMDPT